MTLVHYCPTCREEFRPDVEFCSDCGGALVPRDDADPAARGDDPDALPELEGEAVTLLGVDRAFHLDPLVERLAHGGVLSRVETAPGRFRLQVGEADRDRALGLIGDLLPAIPALEQATPSEHPEGFDPEQGTYAACPACAEPLHGEAECPACGLALAGEGAAGAEEGREQ